MPLEFELERSGLRARRAITAVLAFLTFVIVILGVSPFNNVVVAPGSIAPRGEPVAAHHDSGGAIAQLFVARGEFVSAGQPLMRLRAETLESEIRELNARAARLDLQIERLRALLDDRPARFEDIRASGAAIASERRLYEAESAALRAELQTLETQRISRLRTAEAYRGQAALLAESAAALRERQEMLRALVERGAAARAQLLEVVSQLAESEADRAALLGSETEAARQAEELAQRAVSAEVERRAAWLASLTDALSERAAIEEQRDRRRAALAQRTIAAPVAGRVLRIGGGGPGGVIEPGGLVAEIVPDDRLLVAEVKIAPEKIGEVAVGDEARIFIATFDDLEIGDLRGVVTMIGPGAVPDGEGGSYYMAEVALPPALLAEGRLRPGMSLSANILGAERTVLGYLLRPFERAADAAFRDG